MWDYVDLETLVGSSGPGLSSKAPLAISCLGSEPVFTTGVLPIPAGQQLEIPNRTWRDAERIDKIRVRSALLLRGCLLCCPAFLQCRDDIGPALCTEFPLGLLRRLRCLRFSLAFGRRPALPLRFGYCLPSCGTHLSPWLLCGRGRRLSRRTGARRAQLRNLLIYSALLLLEAFDSGVYDLVREFGRHPLTFFHENDSAVVRGNLCRHNRLSWRRVWLCLARSIHSPSRACPGRR